MDYYPGAFLWGLSASGWSVIGFPILMAIGFVSTMPFNWLADRGKPRFALIIGAGAMPSSSGWNCIIPRHQPVLHGPWVKSFPPPQRFSL